MKKKMMEKIQIRKEPEKRKQKSIKRQSTLKTMTMNSEII